MTDSRRRRVAAGIALTAAGIGLLPVSPATAAPKPGTCQLRIQPLKNNLSRVELLVRCTPRDPKDEVGPRLLVYGEDPGWDDFIAGFRNPSSLSLHHLPRSALNEDRPGDDEIYVKMQFRHLPRTSKESVYTIKSNVVEALW